jgi:hypothetical protein
VAICPAAASTDRDFGGLLIGPAGFRACRVNRLGSMRFPWNRIAAQLHFRSARAAMALVKSRWTWTLWILEQGELSRWLMHEGMIVGAS